jgi:hypothetical protein
MAILAFFEILVWAQTQCFKNLNTIIGLRWLIKKRAVAYLINKAIPVFSVHPSVVRYQISAISAQLLMISPNHCDINYCFS